MKRLKILLVVALFVFALSGCNLGSASTSKSGGSSTGSGTESESKPETGTSTGQQEGFYTISYNLDGGELEVPNPESYNENSGTIVLNNPGKTGFDFEGWTGTGLDDKTLTVEIPSGSTGDRSYTAVWKAIEYSITYNLDGGTLETPNPETYNATDSFILNKPVKSGYTFLYWLSSVQEDNGKAEVVIPQGSTGDRTYAAYWVIENYSITYSSVVYYFGDEIEDDDFDETMFALYPVSYNVEDSVNIPAPAVREGYTFAGWKAGSDSEQLSETVEISAGNTGDRSYQAVWLKIPELVEVEGGTFNMYGMDTNNEEVTVGTFRISDHEVTQKEYTYIMGAAANKSADKGDDLPVVYVNWKNCVEFCNKLSEKHNLEKCYIADGQYGYTCDLTKNGFRLPTTEEWEFAAMGGNVSKGYTYFGSNDVDEVAWWYDNSDYTIHAVKGKKPNDLGLYDMLGNVSEWCGEPYDVSIGTGVNVVSADIMGYSYTDTSIFEDLFYVKASKNYEVGDNNVGFRISRSVF